MTDKKKRKLITEDDLYAGQAPKDLGMAFRRVGPRPSLLIGHALGLLDKKPSKKKTKFQEVDGMKLAVRKKDGGSVKTPKVLPKRKPKVTATSTNKKTGATRGAGDDKEYMRKAAAANMKDGGSLNDAIKRVKKSQGMKDGGEAIGSKRLKPIRPIEIYPSPEQKKKIKDIRLKPIRPKNIFPSAEQREKMKNIEFIRDGIEMKPAPKKMEDGGAVPKKYKGFSKLPERVQQKIDPDLAGKYEKGGVVRGMGRAYAGGSRPVKIR